MYDRQSGSADHADGVSSSGHVMPTTADARDFSREELLSVGIIEIPNGCFILANERIVQASRRHSILSTRKENDNLPLLKWVD